MPARTAPSPSLDPSSLRGEGWEAVLAPSLRGEGWEGVLAPRERGSP